MCTGHFHSSPPPPSRIAAHDFNNVFSNVVLGQEMMVTTIFMIFIQFQNEIWGGVTNIFCPHNFWWEIMIPLPPPELPS